MACLKFLYGFVHRFDRPAVQLISCFLIIVINLSVVAVEDYHAAAPYGQTSTKVDPRSGRDEEPMNDDIIISRVTRDCPDESDGTLDCSDSMHHNKESLIYPVAQFSTRRTHLPRSSTSKSSLMTASARGTDCDPGDENCEGSAIIPNEDDEEEEDDDDDEDDEGDDDEDENENISMGYRPDPLGKQNQSRNKTPNVKYHQGASSKTPAAQTASNPQQRHQVQKPTNQGSSIQTNEGDWSHRRGSTSYTPNPLSVAAQSQSNSQSTYLRNSQDVSSSSIKDRHFQQLAINMNIVLIAGIAAGIVVLLFILVVAACKFYASSTAPAGSKALTDYHQQRAANKAAYAYEACNTGGKCSSPLLIPSSQQSLPVLNTTSQAGLTSVGSATSTVSKPAKKDVKEWYV